MGDNELNARATLARGVGLTFTRAHGYIRPSETGR